MPGHNIPWKNFKDSTSFARFTCSKCNLLLKEPVQLCRCGHRLCKNCADELLESGLPTQRRCPHAQCLEQLEEENGATYFPDRFVQKEINHLEVTCTFRENGCDWDGKFKDYSQHKNTCKYRPTPNDDLIHFVCNASPTQSLNELEITELCDACKALVRLCERNAHREHCPFLSQGRSHRQSDGIPPHQLEVEIRNRVSEAEQNLQNYFLRWNTHGRDEQIASLQAKVTELEKSIESLNAQLENQHFRLSLLENCSYDGSMMWKITQFSQRKGDAVNGKYTSIFSLPFHSGRYGYKMCLRLYIMGDGIGKGTHLSLFFVVMRGEFDNILKWPFTHKVTFKLLNQAGGHDIVDTFQPDPMSSSFRKPKSDMNIASGCPRFVSHTELERGGFIVDDTIFIKCTIDTSSIRHP